MDVHKNARTTPHSRALIAQRIAAGETPAAVARALGVCDRTVHKWVARAAEGPGPGSPRAARVPSSRVAPRSSRRSPAPGCRRRRSP